MCLPPSFESPGSPQRQSSPCLKPPGPRPPGTDDHDDYHVPDEYDDFDKMINDALMNDKFSCRYATQELSCSKYAGQQNECNGNRDTVDK